MFGEKRKREKQYLKRKFNYEKNVHQTSPCAEFVMLSRLSCARNTHTTAYTNDRNIALSTHVLLPLQTDVMPW